MNEDEQTTPILPPNPPGNVAMGIIIFLAVMGVAVGGFSIVSNVRSPFIFGNNSSTATAIDMTDQTQTAKRIESLKTQDTDGDGVSDFDELYTHKTSPYLKDTDSDGFDDKTEIATGHDPNCPQGQNCFLQDLTEKDPATTGILPDALTNNINTSPIDQAIAAGVDPTPDQLRALLRKEGMTEEQISQFDDATLLETYKETIAKTKLTKTTVPVTDTTATPPAGGSVSGTDYSQYTPTQIRDLVRSSGMIPEAQLSLIDDATLKDLFLKAVAANTTTP